MTVSALPLLGAPELYRLLGRYVRLVAQREEVPLTAQGRIRKTVFKSLLRDLGLGEYAITEDQAPQLLFARLALIGLGVFEVDQHKLRVRDAERWLEQPLTQRAQSLLETWLDGAAWNELVELPSVSVTRYRLEPEGQQRLREARQTLLTALSAQLRAAPRQTLSLAAFVEHLRQLPFKLITDAPRRNDAFSWRASYYAAESRLGVSLYPIPTSLAEAWDRLEGAFALHVVSGPLRWMGLIALSQEPRPNNLDQVQLQLTEAGRWLLLGAEAPQWAETGGRIVVQPNFTVLAFEPLPDRVLLDLERFAALQSADRALTYQLTRESVYRAQLQGWNASRIIAFLEAHSGALPANVRRTLEEWEAQHQRIVVHKQACVVQLADASIQPAVLETLRAFSPRALGEHFLLVPAAAQAVVETLQRHGWSPHISPKRSAEPEVRITEDGTITLRTTLPSVHVLDRLQQLADLTPDADAPTAPMRARITQQSVQRAMERGMSVEQYVAALKQLNGGALPHALLEHITRWSRFFGHVRAQPFFRLKFSHARVLHHLLEDEEIAPYLNLPELPIFTDEAFVAAEDLPKVRQLLEARGISFLEG